MYFIGPTKNLQFSGLTRLQILRPDPIGTQDDNQTMSAMIESKRRTDD